MVTAAQAILRLPLKPTPQSTLLAPEALRTSPHTPGGILFDSQRLASLP
jgi:hypothetical protein